MGEGRGNVKKVFVRSAKVQVGMTTAFAESDRVD